MAPAVEGDDCDGPPRDEEEEAASSSRSGALSSMTPAQEAVNALTMALPTLWLLGDVLLRGPQPAVLLLLFGAAVHLPVSFTYHLSVAYGRYEDRLDNDMRRLDQSLQHVVACLYALAMSGSWPYALANAPLNCAAVAWIWDPRTSNDGRRWRLAVPCVLGYTLPMLLWRGEAAYFCAAWGFCMAGGTAAFAPGVNAGCFGGWGHAVFHLALVVQAWALAASARSGHVFSAAGLNSTVVVSIA